MAAAASLVVLVGLFIWSGPVGPMDPGAGTASQQAVIEQFMRDGGFPADVARAVAHRSLPRVPRPVIDAGTVLDAIEGGS